MNCLGTQIVSLKTRQGGAEARKKQAAALREKTKALVKNLGTPRNRHKSWGKENEVLLLMEVKILHHPGMYQTLSEYKSWDKTTKLNWCRFFLINSRK